MCRERLAKLQAASRIVEAAQVAGASQLVLVSSSGGGGGGGFFGGFLGGGGSSSSIEQACCCADGVLFESHYIIPATLQLI